MFYLVCLTFVIIKFDVSCVFSFVDPYTLLGPLVGRLSSTGNNCHFIYFHVHLKKFVSHFFFQSFQYKEEKLGYVRCISIYLVVVCGIISES